MENKPSLFARVFGIDVRSLVLFRCGLAIVLLWDLAIRAGDITAFYTDNGVLPRAALLERNSSTGIMSWHLLNGTVEVQSILFLLQALCAIGLLVGYRTGLMTFLSWILLASLQRRNPLILGGADNYLRMMLFWSLFLPLGIRLSLDNLRSKYNIERPSRIFNWATTAALLQTAIVYIFTALHKWKGETWHDGSALYYAFNVELYARPQAEWLLHYPDLMSVLTRAILYFELWGPFLLFLPWWHEKIRTFTALIFIVLQMSFHSLLYLELFPAISIVAMTLFLPTWFWETHLVQKILPMFSALSQSPTALNSDSAKYQLSPLLNGTAALCLIAVFGLTLSRLVPETIKFSPALNTASTFLYLDQAWKMFAPNPSKISGWVVVPATLNNGTQVDASRPGTSLIWEKPEAAKLFKNERWRKFQMNFLIRDEERAWKHYASYLCRSWNSKHTSPEQIASLQIVTIKRVTRLPGQDSSTQKKILWSQSCTESTSTKKNKRN